MVTHCMPPSPLTHTQIYMYCVWHGWIIQLFLFLAILKLSLNYLRTRYNSPSPFSTLLIVFLIIQGRPGNKTMFLHSGVFLALFSSSPAEERRGDPGSKATTHPCTETSFFESFLQWSGRTVWVSRPTKKLPGKEGPTHSAGFECESRA